MTQSLSSSNRSGIYDLLNGVLRFVKSMNDLGSERLYCHCPYQAQRKDPEYLRSTGTRHNATCLLADHALRPQKPKLRQAPGIPAPSS